MQWNISGTVSPDKCKVGKFNNQTGQKFSSNCENCTEGYYCDEVGLAEPKGTCTDGYGCFIVKNNIISMLYAIFYAILFHRYYCPPGSDSPTEEDCRPGFYCQNGTKLFQMLKYLKNVVTGELTKWICLITGLEYPCQAGTFMTQPKATECDPCPAGQYCVDGINPEACPIGMLLQYLSYPCLSINSYG